MEFKEYTSFIVSLKERIKSAQYEALKAVNKEYIELCWDIGKSLSEKQKQLGWGKSVVEQVAKDLQAEFAGQNGFSSRNLWRMKQFYELYAVNEFLPPMVAEIGWAHNVVIMEKCKEEKLREFYILMTKKFGWTKTV